MTIYIYIYIGDAVIEESNEETLLRITLHTKRNCKTYELQNSCAEKEAKDFMHYLKFLFSWIEKE